MYVQSPVRFKKLVMVNAACALIVMPNETLGPALSPRAVISSLPVADAVIVNAWLGAIAAIVIKKSMFTTPLTVFDADAFAVMLALRPPNDAVTVNAFADTAGLFNVTRTTNVVPATYVPLPPTYAGAPGIVNDACALIAMVKVLLIVPDAPNARPEISSIPVTVVKSVTVGWLDAPVVIVISRSMIVVPLTVFVADPFIEMPVAPPNVTGAVTVSALADAAGLLNVTRATNVCPATYVPLPLIATKLVIVNAACALIAITRFLVNGPNDRPEYSSVPVTVDVIVTVGWLGAPAVIVNKKSM
jgi:hypothetical protein